MTITFDVGPPCAGGNHWDVTVNIDGEAFVVPVTYQTDVEPQTHREKEKLAVGLVNYLMSTASDVGNMTSVRSRLAAHNIAGLP